MNRIMLPALALSALSTGALAEPMALTDAQMDAVTAGQTTAQFDKFLNAEINENLNVNANINKQKRIDVDKNVRVETFLDLQGNIAEAEALADTASFFEQFSETFTYAVATDEFTVSFSESLAAVDTNDFNGPTRSPSG